MSNQTEVINRALVKIGANTIASPGEESEQARKAALIFETVAQNELRRQGWSFAKRRANLAPLATPTGLPDFSRSFNLPSDCLRVLSVNGAPVEYVVEGRTLQTNEGAVKLLYVADVSGETVLWDAAFVEAMACRLALELVQSLAKNGTLKQSLKQDYAEALKEARRTNAIELPPQQIADDSWVASRYG